jgi:hypothetical protein
MNDNLSKNNKEESSNSLEKEEENTGQIEKINEEKEPSISDSIGFNKLFILEEGNLFNSDSKKETENNQKSPEKEKEKKKVKKNEKEKEDFEYKISIDLSDVNNKKLHNYLSEDLIDAIDKSLDDPIDNQYNENDTNYSQNNISNDNDIFNNYPNINNNIQFYPKNININSIHNTISFFPKANKKKVKENEESNVNNNNTNNMNIKNENSNEKSKSLKKLVDYFGGSSPLDAPIYIPQKFKSLKFNQKPNKIGENEIYYNKNNVEPEKKEEKCKKPFEIREGDWTCEFCYNLNFAFRTKCNRCGVIKDFLQIKNNLTMNNNDNFQNYQKMMPSNIYFGNNQNSFPIFNNNDFSNNMLFSPNASSYH